MVSENHPSWVEEVYEQASRLEEAEKPGESVEVKRDALDSIFDTAGAEYEHLKGHLTVFFEYGGKVGKIDSSGRSADVTAMVMEDTEVKELLGSFDECSYGVPDPEQVPENARGMIAAVETVEDHHGTDYSIIDQTDIESIDRFERRSRDMIDRAKGSMSHDGRSNSPDKPSLDLEPREFPYGIEDREIEKMVETADLERIIVDGQNMIENVGRVLEYIDRDLEPVQGSESIIPEVDLDQEDSKYF